MTHANLPPRAALKDQARRLRGAMADSGAPITQSVALETVARQWGYRDWNTLSAMAPEAAAPDPRWQVGQRVTGRYLGQPFAGRIKGVTQASGGFWTLVLVFDTAVDVATSPRITNLRRQVRATVNAQGVTAAHTSDGQPHLVLHAA